MIPYHAQAGSPKLIEEKSGHRSCGSKERANAYIFFFSFVKFNLPVFLTICDKRKLA